MARCVKSGITGDDDPRENDEAVDLDDAQGDIEAAHASCPKFQGSLIGCHDRFDDPCPHALLLHGPDPLGRGSAGGSDLVAQDSRVQLRLLGKGGGGPGPF